MFAHTENIETVILLRGKRGYSITVTPDGKVVRDATTLKAGDEIITKLNKGKITSIIK